MCVQFVRRLGVRFIEWRDFVPSITKPSVCVCAFSRGGNINLIGNSHKVRARHVWESAMLCLVCVYFGYAVIYCGQ